MRVGKSSVRNAPMPLKMPEAKNPSGKKGGQEHARREKLQEMSAVAALARGAKDGGLLDLAADEEHQEGRQDAREEEHAPRDRLGKLVEEHRVEDRRGAPADGPSA